MVRYLVPQFHDPASAAKYLGESVGTHYSVALRATEAFGRHLAAKPESLLSETFEGEGLGAFWRDLLKAEEVRIGSHEVLRALSTHPSHYSVDFLDTADAVFLRRYEDLPLSQRSKAGKAEHALCLRVLRNQNGTGAQDHFAVQNKVAAWMRLLKMMGGYQP
jgi:hypothetical protein